MGKQFFFNWNNWLFEFILLGAFEVEAALATWWLGCDFL